MNRNLNVNTSSGYICITILAVVLVTLLNAPVHAQRPSIAGLQQQILNLETQNHTYQLFSPGEGISVPEGVSVSVYIFCDIGDVVLGGGTRANGIPRNWSPVRIFDSTNNVERQGYRNSFSSETISTVFGYSANCMDTTPSSPDRSNGVYFVSCDDIGDNTHYCNYAIPP